MGLVTAREKIHAKISATMPIGTMARDFALQFLAAEEAMDELKHNLRSELVLVHEFLSTLYTQVRRAHAQYRIWVMHKNTSMWHKCMSF